MPIAFDTAVDGGNTNPGTSHTWSHTCSGSDRLLVISVFANTTDTVTGATYNGVAMTLVNKRQVPSDRWVYMFYMLNPATGANNITVTSGSSTAIFGSSASYTGVRQSAQPDASTTNTGNTVSSLTTSVTTISDNCWTVLACKSTSASSLASGTGSTTRDINGDLGIFDSNGAITPAGSTSMQVTRSGAGAFATVMASFAPEVPPPAPGVSRNLSLLGVG